MSKQLRKQQVRLIERRKVFDVITKRMSNASGFKRPGSMSAHKSHPIGKGR